MKKIKLNNFFLKGNQFSKKGRSQLTQKTLKKDNTHTSKFQKGSDYKINC